ncbi:MAG: T9SS type A sorting domain-containing protein [Saprospiraceae bacterium]|nr:T9SS type A sorting domain-containing protein [Saprospiraceae bacterium]
MKNILSLMALLGTALLAKAQYTPPVIIDTIQDYYQNFLPYDWDHDGDLDFVGATGLGYYLSWIENTGGSLPETATVLDSASYYNRPLFADFNGDNRTDIVFNGYDPNIFDNTLTIRLQLANGIFGPPIISFPNTDNFKGFILTDLDQDNDVDFVRDDVSGLLWYENDGTGNFEPPQFIADPAGGVLHAADLNADGLLDLLVADAPEAKLWYFEALGGGSFKPKSLAANLPDWLERIASADLDGDALPDLLPIYRNDIVSTAGQTWFKNTGNGQFAPPQPLVPNTEGPYIVQELITGDVDYDGDPDVIAAYSSGDSLTLFMNTGSGSFSAQVLAVWPEVNGISNLSLNDYDGDGLADLFGHSIGTAFLRNEGGGQFAPKQTLLPKFYNIATAAVADLNQDGLNDIIARSEYDGNLFWYPNLGGGQFGAHREVSHTNYEGAYARAADWDGDGDTDILSAIPKKIATVAAQTYELVWYKNDGSGNFGDGIRVFPPDIYFPTATAEIADMDGDGDMDIVCLFAAATQTLAWLANDGSGGFGPPVFISPGDFAGQFLLSDLDGDSDKDILFRLDYYKIYWYANDGAGHFSDALFIGTQLTYGGFLAAEDFDGDGDIDVLSDDYASTTGWWYPNNGDNSFAPAKPLSTDLFPSGIADLNEDGKPDLVGYYDRGIGWKPNLGNGVLGDPIIVNINLGNFPTSSLIGTDLDGDGDGEILYSWFTEIGYVGGIGGLPYISGYCFLDENENGQRDSAEALLPGIRTTLGTASQFSFSDEEGEFRFYVTPGNYTLTYEPDECWILTSDISAWLISVADTAVLDRYFGFKPGPGVRNLETFLSSGPTICGQDVMFWLQALNRGCLPTNGKLALANTENLNLISAEPAPDAIVGDTLFWQIDSLFPNDIFKVNLLFNLGVLPGGDSLHISASSETFGADGTSVVLRDTFLYQPVVLCSYDPNDKLVNLAELAPDFLPETSELVYTVRFQNTGNYLAFNIRIRDTLDASLDWQTLRPLTASHDFFTNLDFANGIVEFNFPNIMLADSFSNEPLSHGFVAFTIRPKAGLAQGTLIPNRAGIYFDFNPPVITNYAETTVKTALSVRPEKQGNDWVSVYPNPASGSVQLQFGAPPGKVRMRIFDLQGRACLEKQIAPTGTAASFDVSGLISGVYLLDFLGEDGRQGRAKLVVQR